MLRGPIRVSTWQSVGDNIKSRDPCVGSTLRFMQRRLFSLLNASRPKVLVIAGPTGAGKSDLSLQLARNLNGEIISADSAQIYTHMNIGTDKVSAEDRAQVPHHLIDIVSPTCTTFSAHSFAERATTAIQDIASRGRTPIIVGGTGFFLRWLFYNLPSDSATVPLTSSHGADPALRAKLEHEVEHFLKQCQCSRNEAWSKLIDHYIVQLHSARQSSKQIDGDVPSNTDAITIPDHARLRELGAHDQRRLVRRLELFLTSHTLPQPPRVLPLAECSHLPFDYRCFFLSPPRIWAARRTDYRVEQMIDRGLLNEVAQLMSQQLLTANSPAATSIGYRGTIDYLNKADFSDVAFRTFLEDLMATTRKYSRRQRMWFRTEDIYEFVNVNAPQLSPNVEVSPSDLRMPSNARLHLEQHLTRVFNMSHSEYWQQYRTSDACRQQQASLRTASMETEGSGRSKHGMSTYVSQCHIFRADRRSSAKSTRAAL